MKTRRPPRWTVREKNRFALLALVEATNPERMSERNWNELARLDRIRRAHIHASTPRSLRRRIRRADKYRKRLFASAVLPYLP